MSIPLETARAGAADDAPLGPPARRDDGPGTRPPAVFLDRDGTLLEHVAYLADPAEVRLVPGAAAALARLRRAGFRCVLVTNQSAVGRGIITEPRLHEIHRELARQLAGRGAALDGIYYCPDAPAGDDRAVVLNPDRKPGPGMLLRASAELGLDLAASWMVGDQLRDVLAGLNAGCRSILVASGPAPPSDPELRPLAGRFLTAPDLPGAAELILEALRRRE